MNKEQNSIAFYKKLKSRLDETTTWPSVYLYKFIVPSSTDKIKAIEDIFDNMGAVIKTRASRNGKYTSISINVNLKNSEEVIEKYKAVSAVEGVISL